MTPTKEADDILASRALPLELRRGWTVHRSEHSRGDLMLSGIVGSKDGDEVISPYLMRQNLVLAAHPFRSTSTLSAAL
jgi:hypothetical protein